jgi:transposase
MSADPSIAASDVLCPYCNETLRWASLRWFGLGVFECERCGEFPDFRQAERDRLASNVSRSAEKA